MKGATMELAYLGVETTERNAFDAYLRDVVGLVRAPADEGMSAWRNDDAARRILVQDGPANDAVYFGFEARADAAFDEALRRLDRYGCAVTQASPDELAVREVDAMVHTTTPWGGRVEIARGLARADTPFESALMPSGFLTGTAGFGHLLFGVPAGSLEAADRFVTEALGLRQSDWIVTDELAPVPVTARFYHCNERHHSVALAGLPLEGSGGVLHHFMLESNTIDDVGLAYDRTVEARAPIAMTIGKHDNDRMTSFYGVTPAGFLLEIGSGAVTITDDWSGNRQYTSVSAWGHKPPALLAY